MSTAGAVDYTHWDWLPKAAEEIEAYILRLLAESGIKPHDVSARAKSIASFQRKQDAKGYTDPVSDITDIVAVRIITYSNTDRERASELVRSRFAVKRGEDRNPGETKPDSLRGYDCRHIVVFGEDPLIGTDWLVSGGDLERYFATFNGLEVQVRTVAGHAWAEFEHARRYKGAQYGAIGDQDRGTIDQLFGAASDARRALDETFVAIDRILARPSVDSDRRRIEEQINAEEPTVDPLGSPLDASALAQFLRLRFPKDGEASQQGIDFGAELVGYCNLKTIEALESVLDAVNSERVRVLMDTSVSVTNVRRLDDELLARFGEEYISMTARAGSVKNRAQQLEWRFDRLRGKGVLQALRL